MLKITAIVDTVHQAHGECFMWKRNSDPRICIDAGGTQAAGFRAGAKGPKIVILSHDDQDHIGGAVDLIRQAKDTLKELWVPVEWAILMKQLSETSVIDPGADAREETRPIEEIIYNELSEAYASGGANHDDSNIQLSQILQRASETISAVASYRDYTSDDLLTQAPKNGLYWYGASSLKEIVDRVLSSGHRLMRILDEACAQNVKIRFFSIDLALRHCSNQNRPWLHSGLPKFATLANALEAPFWQAVQIPAGIPYTYKLTQLTVQNRRSLCTLLWGRRGSISDAVIIWSDSDGNWLDTFTPLGFDKVTARLAASSAPHHASGNTAHQRIWDELQKAPQNMIMISAGGQRNQTYAPDYLQMGARRCCTWCRPGSAWYQSVTATGNATRGLTLLQQCHSKH